VPCWPRPRHGPLGATRAGRIPDPRGTRTQPPVRLNHKADALWEEIDPELWRETGNAWLVVQSASRTRLRQLWSSPRFRQSAEALHQSRRSALSGPAWFAKQCSGCGLGTVAFFSMEYALSEALPIYSGGLGNVAGDYLKAASDLGVPIVGVGLLYQRGYFRQTIDASGAQREFRPFNDVSQLPVMPVRDADGGRARVRLPRAGPSVWLRAWHARVGRVPLYLLDSNDPANVPADRGITAELYGGGPETRLLQEMALGIGGWRLLQALEIAPDVCHLNEGHATLAALERARAFMHDPGVARSKLPSSQRAQATSSRPTRQSNRASTDFRPRSSTRTLAPTCARSSASRWAISSPWAALAPTILGNGSTWPGSPRG
jgi:glycogen phosphorylase